MAPLTWKLLLATLASGQTCSQSETCEDQTALLQSHLASHKSQLGTTADMLNFPKVASLTDPSQRKMALTQFEHTALELAKNKEGVTPLVIQVCAETSELLRDTVMAAITSEHQTDEAMLETAYAAFGGAEEQRLHYEALILSAIETVHGSGGLLEQHRECRSTESTECVECGQCIEECTTHRTTCGELEAELRLKYIDVIDVVTSPAYCDAQGNIRPPTTDTIISLADHHLNKQKMEEYLAALAAWEACSETETSTCEECPDDPHTCVATATQECVCLDHDDTRRECNTLQRQLEDAQCQSRHSVSGYMTLYQQAFDGATYRYHLVETQTRIMEADRKVEWDVLERVICLLTTLTTDQDGAASSTATADAIQQCEDMDVDVSRLNIDYPTPPGLQGLPDLPLSPCSDEWRVIYDDIVEGCAGEEHLQSQYEHGVLDGADCTCSAEPPAAREIGFPFELGPFMMFDTGLTLRTDMAGVTEGFMVQEGMEAWEAIYEGVTYRGRCSPFADVTLSGLDLSFGLEVGTVARLAWAYPDQQAYDDMLAATGTVYTEDMTHRFLRTGGFVYINAAGETVALKEISVATPELAVTSQLTLEFESPQDITEDQANHACPGGFGPITIQALRDAGAVEYCWDKSQTLSICPHGCFHYRTEGIEAGPYIAFPVSAESSYIPPHPRAATDQQGAGWWHETWEPEIHPSASMDVPPHDNWGQLAAAVPESTD